MTIDHTPQCDKITCKAFGMDRQAVPVSGTGHARLLQEASQTMCTMMTSVQQKPLMHPRAEIQTSEKTIEDSEQTND